jgi:hypothetical protein
LKTGRAVQAHGITRETPTLLIREVQMQKRTPLAAAILLAGLGLNISQARADCVCRCVNGQVQALCANAIDMKPICSPTICPIAPPAVQPIQAPRVPPIGTTQCRQAQVMNPVTKQYQWQTVCK